MFGTWPLFRIAGIQVVTNWTIILLALIAGSIPSFLALVLTILLHELGHALTAKVKGAYVDGITLGFVGLAQFHGHLTSGARALIAFAGPAVNLITSVIVFVVLGMSAHALSPEEIGKMIGFDFLHALFVWSLLLGVFNLIPALPMDGGWITQHLLELTTNRHNARILALRITIGVCAVFVLLFITKAIPFIDPLFGLIFFGIFAFMALSELKVRGSTISGGAGMWQQFSEDQKRKSDERKQEKKHKQDMATKARVNQLLTKISKEGMQSLTEEERRFLTDASDHFKK